MISICEARQYTHKYRNLLEKLVLDEQEPKNLPGFYNNPSNGCS